MSTSLWGFSRDTAQRFNCSLRATATNLLPKTSSSYEKTAVKLLFLSHKISYHVNAVEFYCVVVGWEIFALDGYWHDIIQWLVSRGRYFQQPWVKCELWHFGLHKRWWHIHSPPLAEPQCSHQPEVQRGHHKETLHHCTAPGYRKCATLALWSTSVLSSIFLQDQPQGGMTKHSIS